MAGAGSPHSSPLCSWLGCCYPPPENGWAVSPATFSLTNTNLKKIDIYKTFFKEHYNVKIKADLQEVFGTYGIYKLSVKEKK